MAAGMVGSLSTYAQFGCGSAVVLSDGYTASAITTPGTGGAEDWNTNPTTSSISTSYWDDDVYIFEYTAVAAVENISMTIFTRNTWNGIGIFDNCTGVAFDTELDALGSGGSSSISQTVSATINAGNTVYIAIGQWGTPDNLDFDVTDFTVTAITCPDPTTLGVSNLMATSADLDWTEAGTAGEWNIEYGAPGFVLGAGTIVNTTVASPYSLGGLTAAIDYEFYVRSICGPGDSSAYVGPFPFSTPCAVLSVPHDEDFTTFVATCWDEAGSGDWMTTPGTLGSSDWAATDFLNDGGANEGAKINLFSNTDQEWILSPQFDLSAGGPYELVVEAGVTSWNGTAAATMGSDDSVMVLVSTDLGVSWSSMYTWDAANNPSNNAGQNAIIDLTAYTGANTMFAIYASDGTVDDGEDYDFHIGNFEIRMPLACADPIGFTATAIDTNEIELTWAPGGTETEWLIEYGTTGFTPGTGTQESTISSPDTITALLSSQGYQFYIQAVCAPGDSSTWVGPIAATTLAPPAYCITGVGPTSTADSNLDGVAMTGETTSIAFTNSCTPAPIGVIDETAQAADVLTGYNYSIDVSAGTCGGNYTNGLAVWVDWNQDLTFDPSEQVGVSSGTAPYSSTFSFDVPTDALLGTTRMRVMQHETTGTLDPCGSYSWGGVADFTIDVAFGTSCAPITGLTAEYIGLDSVAVSWTANGSESGWSFELGTAGFTPGTATEVYGSNPATASDSLNGLMTGTDYDVYVLADCGADSSVWVGPLSITTLLTCPEPSGLGGTVISSDSISLSWTPGDSLEVEWLIEYGIDGFTPGTGTQVASFTNPSDTISGLDGATTYDFYIQGVCGAADSSVWFGPFTLSTPVSNDDPCNAISLPIDGVEYQYSNFGATASTEEAALVIPAGTGASTCSSTDGWCSFELTVTQAMWFSFDAPASGNVNINCSGTAYDGQLAVFDGDCSDLPSMTFIGGNDDAAAGGFAPELALCGLTPGMTYYVMHDEYAGTGDGTISFVLSEVTSSAGNDGSLDVCESDSTNLFNGITSAAENGVWALLSDPAAIVNDSLIDASVLTVGTYDVLYILSNTCFTDTAHATVNVLGTPSAGTAVSPINACNTEAFSLMTGLTGTVDLGGTWSDDSSTGLLVGDSFNALGVTPGSYDFTYTVNNGVCADVSTTITVEVDDCVGIGENESLDFTVYPNPNNGSFAIRNNGVTNEVVITVIDLNGKLIYSESRVLDGVELLPIDLNVDSGIYRLSITSDTSVSSYKVVVE